ncbi:MAG TPA: hypothetical protein VIJ16_05630, partial [Gemmatimonadaceae bacterium]
MSRFTHLALAALLGATSLAAQRTPPPRQALPKGTARAAPAVVAADTGSAAKASPGYALDFQDQDIHVVLSA